MIQWDQEGVIFMSVKRKSAIGLKLDDINLLKEIFDHV